jgi:hypothetical protein
MVNSVNERDPRLLSSLEGHLVTNQRKLGTVKGL